MPEGFIQRAGDRLHLAMGFKRGGGEGGAGTHTGPAAGGAGAGEGAGTGAGAGRGVLAWPGPEEKFWDLIGLVYGALRLLPVMVQVRFGGGLSLRLGGAGGWLAGWLPGRLQFCGTISAVVHWHLHS